MPTEYFQHRSSGDPNLAGIANKKLTWPSAWRALHFKMI